MKLTPPQQKIVEEKKKKAIELYKQGMTFREIGALLNRSRTWAWKVIKQDIHNVQLTPDDKSI